MNVNPIKTIIVEDMVSYIDTIEMLLQEVAPDVRITGKAPTLKEAGKMIITQQPDLVLLDIQFEREGRTGYDLLEELEKLKQLKFQIIIITGHTESEYYSRAYDFSVIHFLKKPVNKHKLSDAIDRVRNNLNSQRLLMMNGLLKRDYQVFRSASRNSKLSIEGTRYNEVVDISEIVWIEAEGRKTVVHIKGGKIFNSNSSIGYFEEQLLSHNRFIRIHRSEIINLDFVERYSVKERLIVIQDPVPNHFASKERFPDFLRKIENEV